MEEGETLSGHKADVVWLIGLSESGELTIAKKLEHTLSTCPKVHTMFLDGDNLRNGLNEDISYLSANW